MRSLAHYKSSRVGMGPTLDFVLENVHSQSLASLHKRSPFWVLLLSQRDFSLLAADYPVSQSAIARPAICTGCRYYYGRSDSGHLLNCTIHPSGPEAEDCRDRESE